MKIAAYADMDLSNDIEGKFQEYLIANGFYRAWKSGEEIITLPKQSVWKLYEAKEDSKEEEKRVFSIMLAEITELCLDFNKGKSINVGIANIIILGASPWAGLADLTAAKVDGPKFGGWKDAETEKAYKEFSAKLKEAGLTSKEEEISAMFKVKNGIQ